MRTRLFALFVLLAAPSFAQQSVPDIPSIPSGLSQLPPGTNFGEVAGVAVNSRVTSSCSRARTARAVRLRADSGATARVRSESEFLRELGRDSTGGRSRTACASTRMTTSGLSTKAPTW